MRKNVLRYDNVMNDQRKVIFERRREFMAEESVRETVDEYRHDMIDDVLSTHLPKDSYPSNGMSRAQGGVGEVAQSRGSRGRMGQGGRDHEEAVRERLRELADAGYGQRVEANGPDLMGYVEKQVLLQALDHLWREHLVTLDQLRQVVGWRGYAQRDPLKRVQAEAFTLFNGMVAHLRDMVTGQLMRVEVVMQPPPLAAPPVMEAHHIDPVTGEDEMAYAGLNAGLSTAGRPLQVGRLDARLRPDGGRRARRRASCQVAADLARGKVVGTTAASAAAFRQPPSVEAEHRGGRPEGVARRAEPGIEPRIGHLVLARDRVDMVGPPSPRKRRGAGAASHLDAHQLPGHMSRRCATMPLNSVKASALYSFSGSRWA